MAALDRAFPVGKGGRVDPEDELLAFDRFPKGWSLTTADTALLPSARKVEDDMHALLRVAQGGGALTGTVRISAPPALAVYLLAPRLRAMLHGLPGIDIDLRGEARVADLTRRQAEIALRFERPSAPGLVAKLLGQVEYALYANAGYLAGRTANQWEFLGYDELLADMPQQIWLDKIRAGRRCCRRPSVAVAWPCCRATRPRLHRRSCCASTIRPVPCGASCGW